MYGGTINYRESEVPLTTLFNISAIGSKFNMHILVGSRLSWPGQLFPPLYTAVLVQLDGPPFISPRRGRGRICAQFVLYNIILITDNFQDIFCDQL